MAQPWSLRTSLPHTGCGCDVCQELVADLAAALKRIKQLEEALQEVVVGYDRYLEDGDVKGMANACMYARAALDSQLETEPAPEPRILEGRRESFDSATRTSSRIVPEPDPTPTRESGEPE